MFFSNLKRQRYATHSKNVCWCAPYLFRRARVVLDGMTVMGRSVEERWEVVVPAPLPSKSLRGHHTSSGRSRRLMLHILRIPSSLWSSIAICPVRHFSRRTVGDPSGYRLWGHRVDGQKCKCLHFKEWMEKWCSEQGKSWQNAEILVPTSSSLKSFWLFQIFSRQY